MPTALSPSIQGPLQRAQASAWPPVLRGRATRIARARLDVFVASIQARTLRFDDAAAGAA